MKTRPPKAKLRAGPVLGGTLIVLGLTVLGFLFRHEVGPALHDLEAAVQEAGPYGPLVFTLAYAVWATLCLPCPVMLAAAAALFASRPWVGIACVSVGDTLAQAAAFLIARRVAQERVRGWVQEHAWFRWLEEQMAHQGGTRVALVRLMPFFPNSLANYAFGLTPVAFGPYLLASWAGSLPNTGLYVGGTAGVIHLLRDRSWEHDVWLAVGVVLLAAGALYGLGAFGSRWLRRSA